MKRRVLRAHANKRSLRMLSAEHALRLDAYNILCDASFLRSVILQHSEDNSNSASGAARALVKSLRELVLETFGAAASHATQQLDAVHEEQQQQKQYVEKRGKRDLHVTLCYLPETATALRRMVPPSQEKKKRERGQEKGRRQVRSSAVEALLSGIECVGNVNEDSGRNEAKAIAQFIANSATSAVEHGEEQRTQAPKKNAHFYFVATQSHDVRRLLPGNTALIRLTTSPTALWIEKKSEAFHYGSNETKETPNQRSSTAPILSRADIAFMRHLNCDFVPPGTEVKRRRLESNEAGKSSQGDTATPKRTRSLPKRAKSTHGPNPLSMKKKRVREVFRVDSKK